MLFDALVPRTNHYWDLLDCPDRFCRWDPFDQLLVPSYGLVNVNKQFQELLKNEASVSNDKNGFHVKMDVNDYSPEEITVKAVDNNLLIHGKHEEKLDNGFVSREFTRSYTIPEDCCLDNMKSSLSQKGILTIEAPKKAIEEAKNERCIPITVEHEQQNKLNDGKQ